MFNIRFNFSLKICFVLLVTPKAFAFEFDHTKWHGFYAGASVDALQSGINLHESVKSGGTYFNYTQDAPQIRATGKKHLSPKDFSGGIFGGYERKLDKVILGVELSANSLLINNAYSFTGRYISDPNILYILRYSLQAYSQEALRLKLGFVEQQWLGYLTGGVTTTYIKYTPSYMDDNAQAGSGLPGAYGKNALHKIQVGWTVGGGVEYAVNHTWSVKADYTYSNFGSVHSNYPIIPTPTLSEFSAAMNAKANLIIHSLSFGLIYRF